MAINNGSDIFLSNHLSSIDDFLTSILVDALYFWIPVHKVHPSRRPPRGPSPATIASLIREHANDTSTSGLVDAFLAHASLKSYLAGLSANNRLRQEFVSHARRYLSMYSPAVPFELGTTERYRMASGRSEACALARKVILPDTTITHLSGKMVALSEDDENSLKRDFSIIYSHRLGESCLMLGPCRFVNHDCNPNAKFIAQGAQNLVAVVALRRIDIGEEITVSYAENYFGKRNRECMCATCEMRGRGFFGPLRASRTSSSSEAETSDDEMSSSSESGLRRHLTRAHKRQRLSVSTEVLAPACSRGSPGKPRRPQPVLGLFVDKGCRRSSRVRKAGMSTKDYDEVVAARGYNKPVKAENTKPVKAEKPVKAKKPVKAERQKERRTRERPSERRTVERVKLNRRKPVKVKTNPKGLPAVKPRRSARIRTGLITPPLSMTENSEEQTDKSETDWDSDDDRYLHESWTHQSASSEISKMSMLYNAFWGSLEQGAYSDANQSFPKNKQDLADSSVKIPRFESRKCQNKNCKARFILGLSTSSNKRLDPVCNAYVNKVKAKGMPLVCVKCNRHAAIYGAIWPKLGNSDESEDYDSDDSEYDALAWQKAADFVSIW